ncbi:hypothetical protein BX611_2041 [Lutibacter oceani]|uniref:Uncharacterized protein n=1 Tax=Lutibacter oceani TaxID=1853311 RepID=A0A3D9RKK6_9FLAO|nr:hypothetical protein [Lutibacter oceani]REE80399.1 hypothetical protein BX611_2041 [Lutibacter oceani]
MKKIAKLFILIFFVYINGYSQQITIKKIESRLVTHQGVEFIGELNDKRSEDIYMSNNWDNEGVLYLNKKSYTLSNINFNVTRNVFDSRIDREKLFSFKNSSLDSVEINKHLFKKFGDVFYEVLFEKEDVYLLKKHDIKVNKGAINRLNLSEGKSFTSLVYKYLIKSKGNFQKFDFNKRSIVELIEGEKEQEKFKDFVKDQKLSYKKEDDIKEIFKYILRNSNKII